MHYKSLSQVIKRLYKTTLFESKDCDPFFLLGFLFFIKMIKIQIQLLENAMEFLDYNTKQYDDFVVLYVRMLQGIQVKSKYKNVNILLKLYANIK